MPAEEMVMMTPLELTLTRNTFTDESTIGELAVNGKWECFTLEDKVRPEGVKVPGKTAIPAGRYEVIINQSMRFKRELPLLLKVPMFSGIRIHPGNTQEDTEGCILVGESRARNRIYGSRVAFARLFKFIKQEIAKGRPVFITIKNEH